MAAAVFSFSFRPLRQPPIISLGQILPGYFTHAPKTAGGAPRAVAGMDMYGLLPAPAAGAVSPFSGFGARKPPAPVPARGEKAVYRYEAAPGPFNFPRESFVMIHPPLPYELQLYFKDRQSVHLELAFMVVPHRSKKFIVLKRVISSGNLDADLLCSRYLGHYLFIEQERFAVNAWQTVRIDLSK